MSNSFALIFGLCFAGLVALDWTLNDAEYIVLWGRQLLRLIDWLAFWR